MYILDVESDLKTEFGLDWIRTLTVGCILFEQTGKLSEDQIGLLISDAAHVLSME